MRRSRPAASPRKSTPAEPFAWRQTLMAAWPVPGSVPGGAVADPSRPAVPAVPTPEQRVAWDRVLRRSSAGQRAYRDPPVVDGAEVRELCSDCDVDCCSSFHVPVNVVDAARLARTLNLRCAEFLTLIPWHPRMTVHPVAFPDGNRAVVLRRRPDGSCAFLVRIGRWRRCGVHALRPDACRLFPFIADAREQSTAPPGRLLQQHPSHCPWRWPVDDARLQAFRDDLAANEAHRATDRALLSQWRPAAQDDAASFFAWLDGVMARVEIPS